MVSLVRAVLFVGAHYAHLLVACSTRIQHNSQSVFITEDDVAVMKNFDGCDGAAIAELLATDEVR